MKILEKDKNKIKIQITSKEDFWYLTQIISIDDFVFGTAFRKIKLDSGADSKSNVIKRKYNVCLQVKTLGLEKNTEVLKINGTVTNSNYEDLANGSYQAINLSNGDTIEISKTEWLEYQKEKLNEATTEDKDNVLICLLDREHAHLAVVGKNSIQTISNIEGEVAKKDKRLVNIKSTFYEDVNAALEKLKENRNITHIIIGCSRIFAPEIEKGLSDKIKSITTFTTINSISKNGVYEILKNPDLQNILKNKTIANNTKLIEDFFVQLAKDDKIAYGYEDVNMAVESGAVDTLIVTDNAISEYQEKEEFHLIDDMLKKVSKMKGEIKIIGGEAAKRLDSLGGIGALLKFDI